MLIPRISVTVDHHANAVKSPSNFEKFSGTSRFMIRADRVKGLIEEMDGTVLIAYTDNRERMHRTFVEESYGFLFNSVKDFATLAE